MVPPASSTGLSPMSAPARLLASALEPVAGQVYFAPECHELYAGLGFSPSPGKAGDVALPDGAAYFCSRGSVLGQVPGEVIASAFGVFNPAAVMPAVTYGWTLTQSSVICAARTEGATAQLTRILGPTPQGLAAATDLLARAVDGLPMGGKALFSGLVSLGLPGDPLGDVWRLADLLREFRGDAHIAAWTGAGFNGAQIGLLTEAYWGLPLRTYVRTRAWSDADLDAAQASLEERDLLKDGELTELGRAVREEIEVATDRQCEAIVSALGPELETVVEILQPWGALIRAQGGYLATGPHDLARAAQR
jgi:hypothetical protein